MLVMSANLPTGKRATCWGEVTPLDADYHDTEWGVPCHDDQLLFERLMLEGFQAGLSWSTILAKRENFRRAFDGWDAARIANYGPAETERLLADAGIVRNRLKVHGAVRNAQVFLHLREQHGTFDRFIWPFVAGLSIDRPAPRSRDDVPATTSESVAMSRALKAAGMTFVGPTICYAFMQSTGMVNDHLAGCPARGAGR